MLLILDCGGLSDVKGLQTLFSVCLVFVPDLQRATETESEEMKPQQCASTIVHRMLLAFPEIKPQLTFIHH